MEIANIKSPSAVIVNGKLVAENNKALFENNDNVPQFTLNSIHIDPSFLESSTFSVQAPDGK